MRTSSGVRHRAYRSLLLLALTCTGVGCGSSGPQRIPLEGMITRAGKPVEQGALTLTPAKGNKGVAANTAIENGRYRFTRDSGPNPGPHQVLIQEFVPKEELLKRKQSPTTPPTLWQQDFVVPESGPTKKDFQLN